MQGWNRLKIEIFSENQQSVLEAEEEPIALPTEEQEFAYEFIKRLLLAWDPDYTKLTSEEEKALTQVENSGFLNDEEIDWDHLDRIA